MTPEQLARMRAGAPAKRESDREARERVAGDEEAQDAERHARWYADLLRLRAENERD